MTGTPSVSAPQRVLPLSGGQNFRDLGGYAAADGRRGRWGMIFRTGSLHSLSADDIAYLTKLGLRTVVDFRSLSERTKEPLPGARPGTPQSAAPRMVAIDYTMTTNPINLAFAQPDLDRAGMQEAMADGCAELPTLLLDHYRQLFACLLAGDAPLVFNCTAGKDRTGLGAALVLTALGVPHTTIVADYLLSNEAFRMDIYARNSPQAMVNFARFPAEVVKTVMSVDAAYLGAALAAIKVRAGSVEAYLQHDLGVSDLDLEALRARYLA